MESLSEGGSQCGLSLPSESLPSESPFSEFPPSEPCFRNSHLRNFWRIQAPLNQTPLRLSPKKIASKRRFPLRTKGSTLIPTAEFLAIAGSAVEITIANGDARFWCTQGPKFEKHQNLKNLKRDFKLQASHPSSPLLWGAQKVKIERCKRSGNSQARFRISSDIACLCEFGPLGLKVILWEPFLSLGLLLPICLNMYSGVHFHSGPNRAMPLRCAMRCESLPHCR